MIVNTFQSPWFKARKEGWITGNDTALAAATRNWPLRKNTTTTGGVIVPIGANGIVMAFIGGAIDAGDPDGDTFTCKVYVYAEKGMAELVYDVDCTVGALQALVLPNDHTTSLAANKGKFVDTMTSGATNNSTLWLTEVGFAANGGDNEMAVMAFDGLGCHTLYPEFSAITAQLQVYPIFKVY